MPYDSSLDKQVFSKGWENEDLRLVVSIHSYNNGPKKLQLSREIKDADGNFRFAKLGRLTQQEAQALLPLIEEAAKQM